jgi:hypothetical protein
MPPELIDHRLRQAKQSQSTFNEGRPYLFHLLANYGSVGAAYYIAVPYCSPFHPLVTAGQKHYLEVPNPISKHHDLLSDAI